MEWWYYCVLYCVMVCYINTWRIFDIDWIHWHSWESNNIYDFPVSSLLFQTNAFILTYSLSSFLPPLFSIANTVSEFGSLLIAASSSVSSSSTSTSTLQSEQHLDNSNLQKSPTNHHSPSSPSTFIPSPTTTTNSPPTATASTSPERNIISDIVDLIIGPSSPTVASTTTPTEVYSNIVLRYITYYFCCFCCCWELYLCRSRQPLIHIFFFYR